MMARCKSKSWFDCRHYRDRGITVCKRWEESFEAFYRDMGDRPEGRTLDRIDNDGIYEPSNCRWATRSEQGKNTSRIRYLTYDDKTRSVRDWERHLKFGRDVISDRINKLGWSIERALSTKKG